MTESISTWAFIAIIAGVIMIVLGMLLLLALKKREES
jgi:LPXTG-motif cell wall-anchored protein